MSLGQRLYVGALRVHEQIYSRTGGWLGHRLLGMPTLLLRTTGRRSGKKRLSALVYAQDGERYLIVPSNGGAPKPPGWFHNLSSEPGVEIQIGRDRRSARAEVIGPENPDFPRLWKIVNDGNGNRYARYQERTSRQIPVVALS